MAYTNILRFMHLGLKSLDTVFNFYIILLLCVKLVFRAKLQGVYFPPGYNSFMFIQQNASCTFHQYEYLLVADKFTNTF